MTTIRTGQALATLLLAAGCGPKVQPKPAPPPPEVLVTPVVRQDVPVVREWVGILAGSSDAAIRAQVKGTIESIEYREGAAVEQGALLFRIDSKTYQAAVDQAQGMLEMARAEQVKAEQDVARFTPLVKEQAVSQAQLDAATQANLAAKARITSAEAALHQSQIDLDRTQIRAPIRGLVGMATAQIGDLVGPETTLTSISTVDPIRAFFPLSERQYLEQVDRFRELDRIPLDQRPEQMDLILADGSTFPCRGRYEFVDREIDARTGTIRVSARFANPDLRLRPGQFVRMRMTTDTQQGALVVPERAISELQGRFRVAVVLADDTVAIRSVTPGEHFGALRVIDQGLAEDERVIVEGHQKVQSGSKVKVAPYSPDPARSTADAQAPGARDAASGSR